MPKKRAPHAYMYNRPLGAQDTVSLAYPHPDRDGGSTIFYASLSSSVHKMNGTRKRANMVRDELSSIQQDGMSMSSALIFEDEEEYEDPNEIRKREIQASRDRKRNASEKKTVIR